MSVSLLPATPVVPERLAEALWEQSGRPFDAFAVVASLESEGWRDVDAQPDFEDLFDLGAAVYRVATQPRPAPPPGATAGATAEATAEAAPATPLQRARRAPLAAALRSYGVGLMYSLPVAGQVGALLVFGYSLWASVTLTPSMATIIGVGTVGSFVLSGGMVQAMARETSRLLGNGLHGQARRVGFRFAGASSVAVVAAGAVLWLVNWIVPYYPAGLAGTGTLYFVLLGVLWVTLGLLYVQERIASVAVATVAGLLPVVGVVEGLGGSIVVGQALGLATSIGVAWAWAWATLGRAGDEGSGPPPPLPRLSTIVDTTLPFAGYGTGYFAFLFADRIVAWTAPAADPLPFILWFRTSYELGMDWALVVLFPLLALHPYAVRSLTVGLREAMDGPVAGATARFRATYTRHATILVALGLGVSAAVWWGGLWVGAAGPPLLQTMVNDPASRLVYRIAAPAYVLFAVGLLNGLVFLSEGRPLAVLRPLMVALLVNLVVGVVASRALGAELAVAGLLAGAAVFAALTTRRMLRLARTADHLAYAGY